MTFSVFPLRLCVTDKLFLKGFGQPIGARIDICRGCATGSPLRARIWGYVFCMSQVLALARDCGKFHCDLFARDVMPADTCHSRYR